MQKLEDALSHYGIKGKITAVENGPLLKLVEFLPQAGTKLKNIEPILDDVAREIGVSSLRVGSVENSSSLRFELPQDTFQTIDFMSIMQEAKTSGELPICLGGDVYGRPVFADLAKMPHLLVGGTTGSGKSVGLNTFILSLLMEKRAAELKFVLIDPKRIEFSIYNNQKYLLYPVVSETESAIYVIACLVEEMERRYDVLEKSGCKNIKDYNEQTEGKLMPYIVCVIDEFADLVAADKSVDKNVQRLAQKARACGIHLILATQRPSVDVVTGVLKANFPTRLAYKVAGQADSRTILDCGGAEKLVGRGDALFLSATGELQRIHGAYVADKDIKAILEPYRCEVKPLPMPKVTEKKQEKIKATAKKESWLARVWKFWTSLRQKDKKLIVNAVFYIVGMLTGKQSRRK